MELITYDEVWAGILEVEDPFEDEEFRIIVRDESPKKPIIIRRK